MQLWLTLPAYTLKFAGFLLRHELAPRIIPLSLAARQRRQHLAALSLGAFSVPIAGGRIGSHRIPLLYGVCVFSTRSTAVTVSFSRDEA
jgi:hypothetical protein